MKPIISVIIPSYRSEKTIEKTIASIVKQRTEIAYEVIVVDSTPSKLQEELAKKYPSVKVYHSEQQLFPGAARNFGIERAGGGIFLFLDADVVAPENLIEEIIKEIKNGHPVVGAAIDVANPWNLFGWSQYFFEFSEFLPELPSRNITSLATYCFAIEKETLRKAGNFNQSRFLGEDFLLSAKLKENSADLYFTSRVNVKHFNKSSFWSILKTQYALGRGGIFSRRACDLNGKFMFACPLLFFPLGCIYKFARMLLRVFRCGLTKGILFVILSPLLMSILISYMVGMFRGLYGKNAFLSDSPLTIPGRAHVAHIFNSVKMGGAEKQLLLTAKYNNKEKYDLSFVVFRSKEGIMQQIEAYGYPVIELGLSNAIYDLRVVGKLFSYLVENKPRIVHLYGKGNLLARIAAKMAKVPIIICHEVDMVEIGVLRFVSMLKRALDFIPDRVIAVSEAVKRYRAGCHQDKYVIITPPCDFPFFQKQTFPEEGAFKNGNYPVIGTVSRLSPEKGHKYLIRAIPEIIAQFPAAQIRIVGSGHIRKQIERLVKRLKVEEHVQFTGFTMDPYQELSLMDVFVLPSLTEGYGIALMEAMVASLPIAASAVGGIPEIIKDEETGLLFPPADPSAIARSVLSLLNNRKKALEMAKKGNELAKSNFRPEIYIEKLDTLYRELIEEKLANDKVICPAINF